MSMLHPRRKPLASLVFGVVCACGSSSDGTVSGGLQSDGGKPTTPIAPGADGGITTPVIPPGPTYNDAGEEVCEARSVDAYGNTPEMLIVLDRSLSMTIYGRWQPSVMAVKGITSDFEGLLSFGLTLFPGENPLDQCAAGKLDVPTAPRNAAAIAGALDRTGPAGFTPTGAGLELAVRVLGDRNMEVDQKRPREAFVLLVTDGEPSCQGVPGVADEAQRMAATAGVQHLKALNIPTYVFGYQIDPMFQGLMNGLATEGGTDHYYPAESAADIAAAFREITKDVVRCDFELAEDADTSRVDVRIDGKSIDLDPANGWVIAGRTVTLVGAACNTIKDGKGHELNVQVACEPLR